MYQTKTGIQLTVIQGGGDATARQASHLSLIVNNGHSEVTSDSHQSSRQVESPTKPINKPQPQPHLDRLNGSQSHGLGAQTIKAFVMAAIRSKNEQFKNAAVMIQGIGYSNTPTLIVRLKLDAKLIKKHGIGGDVVDLNNWLYRRFGLVANGPSVGGLSDRAKKGFKTLTFHYEITQGRAKELGFVGRYGEIVFLQKASVA